MLIGSEYLMLLVIGPGLSTEEIFQFLLNRYKKILKNTFIEQRCDKLSLLFQDCFSDTLLTCQSMN